MSLLLALSIVSASPPPSVVAPSAVAAQPVGQPGKYHTDLSQSRRWGRAGLAYFGATAAFGAVVFTQVSRDVLYRACLRARDEPDESFLEPGLENLGCELAIRGWGYGLSAGAMAAMPGMLGFVGAAGIALGRGDVDSGRVRSRESLRRAKFGGAAAIGAFGGALLISNVILYSVVVGMEPKQPGDVTHGLVPRREEARALRIRLELCAQELGRSAELLRAELLREEARALRIRLELCAQELGAATGGKLDLAEDEDVLAHS